MKRMVLKVCLMLCLWSPAFSYEELPINDWLTTIDDDTCWMTAHPLVRPRAKRLFHDIRFNIIFPYGSMNPEFSIYTDQINKHNERILVYLGSEIYEFEIITDYAFSKASDDRDILFQMLKGNAPTFVLKVDETKSTPQLPISLSGFKDAYNYISKKCNFHKMPSLPEKLG